jgi:signal peptidase II
VRGGGERAGVISRRVVFSIVAVVFVVDRLTKMWIVERLGAFDVWTVIPGFFQIIHSENRGMAFSLMADWPSPWREVVLIGVASGVLMLVVGLLWRAQDRLQQVSLALVLGGAAGNLYDRVARGSVTDFLEFFVGEWHWPAFNVADAAITSGAILLLLDAFMARKPNN